VVIFVFDFVLAFVLRLLRPAAAAFGDAAHKKREAAYSCPGATHLALLGLKI